MTLLTLILWLSTAANASQNASLSAQVGSIAQTLQLELSGRLVQKQSFESILNLKKELQTISEANEECEIQLRFEIVPTSCFKILELAQKKNIPTESITEPLISRKSQVLERISIDQYIKRRKSNP